MAKDKYFTNSVGWKRYTLLI